MKTLVFMRHAKSDWNAEFGEDFERPLNKRGRRDAPKMGRFIKEILGTPPVIVCSGALRTVQTAQHVIKETGYQGELLEQTVLYSGQAADYLNVAKDFNDRLDWAMLVGHNPLTEDAISLLISEAGGAANVRMPTAALACVDLSIPSWNHINVGLGILRWLVVPKELRD